MKLKRKEQPAFDSSDEEFSVGSSDGKQKSKKETKKKERTSQSLSKYLEASSDDEFAHEHFILPSEDVEEKSSNKSKYGSRNL